MLRLCANRVNSRLDCAARRAQEPRTNGSALWRARSAGRFPRRDDVLRNAGNDLLKGRGGL